MGGAGLTIRLTGLSGGAGIKPFAFPLAGGLCGLCGRYPGGTGGGAFRTNVLPEELEAL